jgi:hypothetical protein
VWVTCPFGLSGTPQDLLLAIEFKRRPLQRCGTPLRMQCADAPGHLYGWLGFPADSREV